MTKLIRDKIPEIIEKAGKNPKTHIASELEYWKKLKEKLSEEVKEFINESNEEELADILEVIDSICNFKTFNKEEIENLRKKKFQERGGFNKRIILDNVEEK